MEGNSEFYAGTYGLLAVLSQKLSRPFAKLGNDIGSIRGAEARLRGRPCCRWLLEASDLSFDELRVRCSEIRLPIPPSLTVIATTMAEPLAKLKVFAHFFRIQ